MALDRPLDTVPPRWWVCLHSTSSMSPAIKHMRSYVTAMQVICFIKFVEQSIVASAVLFFDGSIAGEKLMVYSTAWRLCRPKCLACLLMLDVVGVLQIGFMLESDPNIFSVACCMLWGTESSSSLVILSKEVVEPRLVTLCDPSYVFLTPSGLCHFILQGFGDWVIVLATGCVCWLCFPAACCVILLFLSSAVLGGVPYLVNPNLECKTRPRGVLM